jgi:8-oxo-dGTP pyrophosphatase MutT (NUDIX family)
MTQKFKNPIFKNTHNRNVITTDGESVWLSRSIATVGVVLAKCDDNIYVLISKRSESMVDEPGKNCLPCGYLDFDETLYECMVREVFEETSLYLPEFEKSLINDNTKFVKMNDDPSNNRQNVSFVFLSIFDFSKDNFPIEIETYKSSETEWVKWLNIENINNSEYDWAFNHNDVIKKAIFYSITQFFISDKYLSLSTR